MYEHGYGITIEGVRERTPSEILPVFKYLTEHENYMPLLLNMMFDMIGTYQFPDLRHTSEYMKARRKFLTNDAFTASFKDYQKENENKYYALENNYYIFKGVCVVSSCSAILRGNKKLHDYCMKVCDAAMFGFQNEATEQDKRAVYAHGMEFVPYMQYFMATHLSDSNITQTARLGACFWKVAAEAWPELFPEHDKGIEKFMRDVELPEIAKAILKSDELMRCQQLPKVVTTIYDTLEDYFKVLCPKAVSPRPEPREKVVFGQRSRKS